MPGGRPPELPEPWLSWARRFGSVQALADHFHVRPNTIWRWVHGQPVSWAVQQQIDELRRSMMPPTPARVRKVTR